MPCAAKVAYAFATSITCGLATPSTTPIFNITTTIPNSVIIGYARQAATASVSITASGSPITPRLIQQDNDAVAPSGAVVDISTTGVTSYTFNFRGAQSEILRACAVVIKPSE